MWVFLKRSVIGICLLHVSNYDHLSFAVLHFALRVMCLWKLDVP